MANDHFPYPFRPQQQRLYASIRDAVSAGRPLAIEAPTGAGKTVAALAAALDAIDGTENVVVYVTRTNSQQAQAVGEALAISGPRSSPVRAVAIQGRQHLCLRLDDFEEAESRRSSARDLSHYCRQAKQRADADPSDVLGCRHWTALKQMDDEALRARVGSRPQTAESLRDLGVAGGFCPYEAAKRLLPEATIVVAPYIYVFDPNLRPLLLRWMGKRWSQVIVIVDEAHNVPEYLRTLFSPKVTRAGLRRALKEAGGLDNPLVLQGITAGSFLELLAQTLDWCVDRYVLDDDGFVPPFEVEARLMEALGVSTPRIDEAVRNLAVLGEVIRERKRAAGKIPRSHLSAFASGLSAWFDADDEATVKLAGRRPDNYLEAFMVDAAGPAQFLLDARASVHMSGTLAPTAEYVASLGLAPRCAEQVIASPFITESVTILAVRGLTTRYESLRQDPTMADRLQDAASALASASQVPSAFFFPSHDLRRQFEEIGVFQGAGRNVRSERASMDQEQVMQLLQSHRTDTGNPILVGVMGGRLSEGIDFPGRQLEAMVIVGTPYPKPSSHQRALMAYHERRHGTGWEYTVTAPAQRRLRQTIGRIRRAEADSGLVILLDERSGPLLRRMGSAVETVDLAHACRRLSDWAPARHA